MSERKWWIKEDKYLDKYDGLTLCMGDGKYDTFFLGEKKLQFIHEHWDAIAQYIETRELPEWVDPPDPNAPPEQQKDDDDDDLPF